MENQVSYATYSAYKDGGDRIEKWLENASQQRRRPSSVGPFLYSARPRRYTVAELIAMANRVANTSSLPPPDWVLELLKSVIRQREAYWELCNHSAMSENSNKQIGDGSSVEQHNDNEDRLDGHEHYINILKGIYGIFTRVTVTSYCDEFNVDGSIKLSSESSWRRGMPYRTQPPRDYFDERCWLRGPQLTTATNESNGTHSSLTGGLSGPRSLYTTRDMHLVLSLGNELCDMRKELRLVWQAWCRNEISLLNAATTTNVALIRLRQAAHVPHATNVPRLVSRIDRKQMENEVLRGTGRWAPLMNVYKILESYRKDFSNNTFPDYRAGYENFEFPATETPDKPQAPLSASSERIFFERIWSDLTAFALAVHVPSGGEIDETCSAAKEVRKGKLELWVVLVARVLLDVLCEVRARAETAFDELKTTSAAITKTIALHECGKSLFQVGDEFEEGTKKIYSIGRTIREVVDSDAVTRYRNVCRLNREPVQENQFYLLRHNPVLCGLLKLYLLGEMHTATANLTSKPKPLVSAMLIYSACNREGLRRSKWYDMEKFMHLLPLEKAPVRLASGGRYLHMVLRETALGNSHNQFSLLADDDDDWNDYWPPCLPLTSTLWERFEGSARLSCILETIEELADDKEYSVEESSDESDGKNWPPVEEFIIAVSEMCTKEELWLNFNLLSFLWTCKMLLQKVRTEVRKTHAALNHRGLQQGNQPYHWLGAVFAELEANSLRLLRPCAEAVDSLPAEEMRQSLNYI